MIWSMLNQDEGFLEVLLIACLTLTIEDFLNGVRCNKPETAQVEWITSKTALTLIQRT